MNQNDSRNNNYYLEQAWKPQQKKTVSIPVLIVSIVLTALIAFQMAFVVLNIEHTLELNKTKERVRNFGVLLEALEFFDENYVYEIDEKTLIEHMLYAFGGQDMYSTYYTPEEFNEMISSSQGEASGIGVYITGTATTMEVTYVITDSPAQKAGMKMGDKIIAVDGQKVSEVGYNQTMNLIVGQLGTTVVITVSRNGEIIDLPVVRGNYVSETVIFSEMQENGEKIGYINIVQFDAITVTQFKTAVETLKASGCEKLVFDIRSNPGGELTSIAEILDYLLPKGPVVHILDKNKEVIYTYQSDENCVDMPMAVLINENTASAAELFASALRDYNKATLVGMKTYGKGCGQNPFFLSNGGVIYITTFFYNPPYGENYDGVGVYPDIEVEIADEYKNALFPPYEADTQLKAAIEALTK